MMDEGMKGWLQKQAYRNYWKVANFYELDDLIQDGYYIYYFVRNRYPTATEPAHIMSLVKLCFRSHLSDLCSGRKNSDVRIVGNQRAQSVSWLSPGATDEDRRIRDRTAGTCADADLMQVIVEAPDPIRTLLKELVANPKKLRSMLRKKLRGKDETFNARLCAIAGVDPDKHNLEKDLRDYLRAAA